MGYKFQRKLKLSTPFRVKHFLFSVAISTQVALTSLKAKLGKPSEFSAVHIQCITSLPIITSSNPNQIHECYDKLVIRVQALETMNKLKETNGYARLTLYKIAWYNSRFG